MMDLGSQTFELRGMDKLDAVLEAGGKAAEDETGPATYDVAQDAFALSQRMVPVRTGSLRSSGHVDPPQATADGTVVELAYGGAAASYALYVHEDPTVKHDPPTQWKFLERPVKHYSRDFGERLAQAVVNRLTSA